MRATGLATVSRRGWTVSNRGGALSSARSQPRWARFLTVAAVALLVALTLAPPATALTWYISTVDSEGAVGWWTSIALDASDDPHISYFDRSNTNLKYARPLLPGAWTTTTVDSAGRVGEFSSIAMDSSGYPHISYLDFVGPNDRDLKYARRLPSGSWSTETVDSGGDVGWFSSIALDSSGRPHIAYYDFDNGSGNGKLKYARRSASGGWSIEAVDGGGNGGYPSIALDSSGNPHISYFDFANGNLKYARKVCAPRTLLKAGELVTFCFWSRVTVDAGDVTSGQTTLALDANGLPHIGYTVFGGGYPEVRYARRWASGSWSVETVDSGGVGSHVSLALDSSGVPHLSYPDNVHRTLKYARKVIPGAWSRQIVDAGSTGHNSIALDSHGNPHISYYDDTNGNLKYAKGDPRGSNLP